MPETGNRVLLRVRCLLAPRVCDGLGHLAVCEMPRLAELLALVVLGAEAIDVDFAAGERRLGRAPDDVRLQEHRRVVGGLLPLLLAGVERTRRLLVAQENPVVRSSLSLPWVGRWSDNRPDLEQSLCRFPPELPLEEVQLLVVLVICTAFPSDSDA